MPARSVSLIGLIASLMLSASSSFAWETQEQAAQQVRSLLSSPHEHHGVGVLSTNYPSSSSSSSSSSSAAQLPPLSGHEYFCPSYSNGDLSFIALPVSQNWRNALALSDDGSGRRANVSFAVSSNPDPRVPDARHLDHDHAGEGKHWDPSRPSWRRGMPSKLRFTLFGHMEPLTRSSSSLASIEEVRSSFLRCHPDASHWAPGASDSPHEAVWVRFVVERVYAVGGFGDEHRIGWIEREVYAGAGKREEGEEDDGVVRNDGMVDDDAASPPRSVLFGDNDGGDVEEQSSHRGHVSSAGDAQRPFMPYY